MKASTAVELAGFACLCVAAFLGAGLVVGLCVTGFVGLLIGYAVEDAAAALAVSRVLVPIKARIARLRLRRQNRRFRRTSKHRERRLFGQRQPAEILLRVKGD